MKIDKLDDDTLSKIYDAQSALSWFTAKAQGYFEDGTKKWQESDAGSSYLAWLRELETAVDALDDLPEAPRATP